MKHFFILIFSIACLSLNAQSKKLNLTNVLVVGQLDKSDDRYSIEAALTEILTNNGIKALPSMNILKVGNDPQLLASDSIIKLVKEKGFDTYVLISVRGFDKNFKHAKNHGTLTQVLAEGHLFPIYRDEAVSVSFEFFFYRNGEFIGTDIVKCGNISSRDTVMKRFRKKLNKRISKHWK
jgi:hypothetical protein